MGQSSCLIFDLIVGDGIAMHANGRTSSSCSANHCTLARNVKDADAGFELF
jgi:hypothetical protein